MKRVVKYLIKRLHYLGCVSHWQYVVVVVVVVASADRNSRLKAYGAIQIELMVTSRFFV